MEPNGENIPSSVENRSKVNTISEKIMEASVLFSITRKNAPMAAIRRTVTAKANAALIGRLSDRKSVV